MATEWYKVVTDPYLNFVFTHVPNNSEFLTIFRLHSEVILNLISEVVPLGINCEVVVGSISCFFVVGCESHTGKSQRHLKQSSMTSPSDLGVLSQWAEVEHGSGVLGWDVDFQSRTRPVPRNYLPQHMHRPLLERSVSDKFEVWSICFSSLHQ